MYIPLCDKCHARPATRMLLLGEHEDIQKQVCDACMSEIMAWLLGQYRTLSDSELNAAFPEEDKPCQSK